MTNKKFVKGEYDDRLIMMITQAATTAVEIKAHIEADAKAFAALANNFTAMLAQVAAANADIKNLLTAQAYASGVWRAVTLLAASSGVVALFGLIWRVFH